MQSWASLNSRSNNWILNAVKSLSGEYVAEYNAADDPARPSPYQDTLDVEKNRSAVRQQMAILKQKMRL